jgi:hypothetical protein
MLRLFCVLAIVLVLPGCCGGGTVAPEIVTKIVAALTAAAAMAPRKTKAGQSFTHYVERRVMYLGGKNSGWQTEANYTSLTARIGAEMDQVADFVDERVKTLGGTDPVSPAHRDLDDAAKRLATDGPSDISSRATDYKSTRAARIGQIAWRACAVQPELWDGGDSTLAPALKKAPLTELLDRRLHAVEFLMLHDEGAYGKWTLAGAGAGWNDKQRTSMFQYPWVTETDDFKSALGTAGLTIAGLAPNFREDTVDNRIYYKDQNRPRPPAAGDWTVTSKPYRVTLSGGGSVSAIMERLVPIAAKTDAAFEDFWQRNWVYCDIMLAALHVHSLRFGRARATGGTDAAFDGIAGGIVLRPLIPKTDKPDPSELMSNGSDWYEGAAISHEELQVGDHLVFWNNPFVRHILSSAFGLENSFVTGIEPDGRTVRLAGHGMPEKTETKFADDMASEIQAAYAGLRKRINASFTANPNVGFIGLNFKAVRFMLTRWAPFGEVFTAADGAELRADGAWWIRLRRDQLHDSDESVPSMDDALKMVPKSVRYDSGKHTEAPSLPNNSGDPNLDHDSGFQESIYLPLSVPAGVAGGWDTYLAQAKHDAPVELTDLIPDGSMVRGFYAKGSLNSTIPVLRPKVKT